MTQNSLPTQAATGTLDNPVEDPVLAEKIKQSATHRILHKQKNAKRSKSKVARALWAAGGFVSFGLGFAGAFLPVLPTVPFILLAAFCFARSSEKVDTWFQNTKLYKYVVSSYFERRSMTIRAKLMVLVPVTLIMAIGMFFTTRFKWVWIILGIVWVGHIIYFGFVVKTISEAEYRRLEALKEADEAQAEAVPSVPSVPQGQDPLA